jgi:hypothetical protein
MSEHGDGMKAVLREMGPDELRAAVKEAFRELLGDYVRMFGWWSIRTIAVAGVGAVIVLILWAGGWKQG